MIQILATLSPHLTHCFPAYRSYRNGASNHGSRRHSSPVSRVFEQMDVPSGRIDQGQWLDFQISDKFNYIRELHHNWTMNNRLSRLFCCVLLFKLCVCDRWFLILKVPRFEIGDSVKISDDLQVVSTLQRGHGEWTENMKLVRRGHHFFSMIICLWLVELTTPWLHSGAQM